MSETALVVANRYGEVRRSYTFASDDGLALNRRQMVAMVASARSMARSMWQQTAFSGTRKYYDVLGYPNEITLDQYHQRYDRQDIAGRVGDLPPQDTWKKPPQITEDGNDATPFVQAWDELIAQSGLGVWNRLMRVDKLSGIGRYGVLLLGLRAGGDLETEVKEGALKSPSDVLYLRPLAEIAAKILKFEDDPQSVRYGLPSLYELKLRDDKDWAPVHWSRILHVAENKQSDEVYGTPRLRRVFNRLDDLIKLVGGSAEATWLGMRPGTLLGPKEGYRKTMTDAEIADEISDYAHDPLRMMFMEGVEAQQLGPSEVVNIRDPFDVVLALISAASGIPQRVLIGSAQGEQAAAEWDQKQWGGEVAYRQKNYAEPEILRPFADRLVVFGALPPPSSGTYNVGQQAQDGEWHWPSILEQTDVERAEIEDRRAAAVERLSDPAKVYILSPGERRELVNHPAEWPEGGEPPVPVLPEPPEVQQVRVIPEGSELPVLEVPSVVVISDTDKEQALDDWDLYMPHLRGAPRAEVEAQTEYDGIQY